MTAEEREAFGSNTRCQFSVLTLSIPSPTWGTLGIPWQEPLGTAGKEADSPPLAALMGESEPLTKVKRQDPPTYKVGALEGGGQAKRSAKPGVPGDF